MQRRQRHKAGACRTLTLAGFVRAAERRFFTRAAAGAKRDITARSLPITFRGEPDHRGSGHFRQESSQESVMPILMIALLALACFGAIGILLVAAGMLERKKHDETSSAAGGAATGGKPAA
jgi:hypothetical protein